MGVSRHRLDLRPRRCNAKFQRTFSHDSAELQTLVSTSEVEGKTSMNEQKIDHPAYRRFVTGTSGTGKTTLWMDMLEDHPARYKFIYDVEGEYAQRNRVRKVCMSMDDVVQAIIEKRELIVFDPLEEFPGKCGEGFNCFCDVIFSVCNQRDEEAPLKGVKLMACDELQLVTNNRIEPIEFLTLCETGRRREIDVLVSSHAPNRLHNAVQNQFTWVATFRQSHKRALEYLVDQGFDADQVRKLGEHDHLWKDLKTGENNFQPVKNSASAESVKTDDEPKTDATAHSKAVGS